MHNSTRATLLQRISKDRNDEAAWQEFIELYKNYLYGVIRRMKLNHHDVEEVLQQVTLKLWTQMEKFEYENTRGRFRSWLGVLTRNCALDFLRKEKRKPDTLDDPDRLNYLEKVSPEIEEIYEEEWQIFLFNTSLERLKTREKEHIIQCFELYSRGQSISEIATKLNLSENSVYIYKARVAQAMKSEIKFLKADLD